MPISIEFDFNWYYDPDEFIPPGNCVNRFENIAELVQYIDDEIGDAYHQRNEYENSYVGPQGQILDRVIMTMSNFHGESLNLTLYDRHCSENEIYFEVRHQLQRIKQVFDHTEP